jgi:hypothetical protein
VSKSFDQIALMLLQVALSGGMLFIIFGIQSLLTPVDA